jgi:hypothetical protein
MRRRLSIGRSSCGSPPCPPGLSSAFLVRGRPRHALGVTPAETRSANPVAQMARLDTGRPRAGAGGTTLSRRAGLPRGRAAGRPHAGSVAQVAHLRLGGRLPYNFRPGGESGPAGRRHRPPSWVGTATIPRQGRQAGAATTAPTRERSTPARRPSARHALVSVVFAVARRVSAFPAGGGTVACTPPRASGVTRRTRPSRRRCAFRPASSASSSATWTPACRRTSPIVGCRLQRSLQRAGARPTGRSSASPAGHDTATVVAAAAGP